MCLFSTQIKACAHTFSKHRHHPPALLPSFLPHSRTSLFFPSSSNHQSWKPIAKLRKSHQLTPPTHTPTKLSTLDPFWLKKSLARQAAEQWIRHERFSHPLSHAFSSLRRPLHPAGTDRFFCKPCPCQCVEIAGLTAAHHRSVQGVATVGLDCWCGDDKEARRRGWQ